MDGIRRNLTVLFSEQSRLHDTGPGHPESANRLDAVLEGVSRAGMTLTVPADPEEAGVVAAIERVHGTRHIDAFRSAIASAPGLFQTPDNPYSTGTFAAATGAVAAGLSAAATLLRGDASRAFVVVRPPGHHAERNQAMGFCFFNTIAVVAESLLASGAAQRLAIVDFDVHHGNGTQDHFWTRSDVLFASIHQWPFYPGTGAADERGAGEGDGATINVPLDAGADDRLWLRSFEQSIVRPVEAFAPDMILVSAGFDAHARDPLGGMNLTADAYGEMTRMLVDVARSKAQGRMISLLEGGYDFEGLASGVQAHLAAMQ